MAESWGQLSWAGLVLLRSAGRTVPRRGTHADGAAALDRAGPAQGPSPLAAARTPTLRTERIWSAARPSAVSSSGLGNVSGRWC